MEQIAKAAGASVTFIPEWAGHIEDAEAAFGIPPVPLVEAGNLRFVQLHSAGYDQFRTSALTSRPNFSIANARGITAQAVAEQCLSMMFALTRRIPFQLRNQLQHKWQRASSYELLHGSTVTIIGLGAIGSAVAKMCHGIGMRVFSVQRKTEKASSVDRIFPMNGIADALPETNHLVLALPSIPMTKPLIGAAELAAMPKGSYVYSMSRAALLDYNALLSSLESGHAAGAGLDVFAEEPLPATNPLWDREDVLIAPHSGGRFVGEMDALAALFADNLERYLSGKPLQNVVVSHELGVK